MGAGFASRVSGEAGGFVPRMPFRGAAPAAALTARASFSPRGEDDFGPRASFIAVGARFAAGAFVGARFVAGVFVAGVFVAAGFLPGTTFFAAASTFLATAGTFFAMAVAFFAAGACFDATLPRGAARGVGRRWAKGSSSGSDEEG
jgi:hypothetical protein